MKKIKLANCDKYVIVDDEDYERVNEVNWILNGRYASRYYNKRNQYLAKFILGVDKEKEVCYNNGNTLDNRKENLLCYDKLKIIEFDNYIELHFRNGKIAIVDKDDKELIYSYYWQTGNIANGYVYHQINKKGEKRKVVFLHNLIMNNDPVKSGLFVDHKDRNKLNNRKENLRFCTVQQNVINRDKCKVKTKSKYKGLSYRKYGWEAYIGYNYKKIYLGIFKTEEDAALAYNEKAIELYKEFACLNIIH